VPTLISRLGSDATPRLRGNTRHTWSRYQLLLREAQTIISLTPDPVVLVDDLFLGGFVYPNPGARSIAGIDLLGSRKTQGILSARLGGNGWTAHDYQVPRGYVELWNGKTRLRLHADWLPGRESEFEQVLSRVRSVKGVLVPHRHDQLWRTLWRGLEPQWLVDACLLLEGIEPRPVPRSLEPIFRSAERVAARRLGRGLGLSLQGRSSWTVADWVLYLTHRNRTLTGHLMFEIATDLRRNGQAGRPNQWLQKLTVRWGVSSLAELPAEFLRRWRSGHGTPG
jgi:hypothetical protein